MQKKKLSKHLKYVLGRVTRVNFRNSQSVNDENASLRRVLKYVVPVILFSVVFNLPKVFDGNQCHSEIFLVLNSSKITDTDIDTKSNDFLIHSTCPSSSRGRSPGTTIQIRPLRRFKSRSSDLTGTVAFSSF